MQCLAQKIIRSSCGPFVLCIHWFWLCAALSSTMSIFSSNSKMEFSIHHSQFNWLLKQINKNVFTNCCWFVWWVQLLGQHYRMDQQHLCCYFFWKSLDKYVLFTFINFSKYNCLSRSQFEYIDANSKNKKYKSIKKMRKKSLVFTIVEVINEIHRHSAGIFSVNVIYIQFTLLFLRSPSFSFSVCIFIKSNFSSL